MKFEKYKSKQTIWVERHGRKELPTLSYIPAWLTIMEDIRLRIRLKDM